MKSNGATEANGVITRQGTGARLTVLFRTNGRLFGSLAVVFYVPTPGEIRHQFRRRRFNRQSGHRRVVALKHDRHVLRLLWLHRYTIRTGLATISLGGDRRSQLVRVSPRPLHPFDGYKDVLLDLGRIRRRFFPRATVLHRRIRRPQLFRRRFDHRTSRFTVFARVL